MFLISVIATTSRSSLFLRIFSESAWRTINTFHSGYRLANSEDPFYKTKHKMAFRPLTLKYKMDNSLDLTYSINIIIWEYPSELKGLLLVLYS